MSQSIMLGSNAEQLLISDFRAAEIRTSRVFARPRGSHTALVTEVLRTPRASCFQCWRVRPYKRAHAPRGIDQRDPNRQQARLLQPGAVLQHHRAADPGAAGETLPSASPTVSVQWRKLVNYEACSGNSPFWELRSLWKPCCWPLCSVEMPETLLPMTGIHRGRLDWCWQLVEHRNDVLLFKRRPPVITGDQSGRGGRSTGVWSRRGSGEDDDDDGEEEEMIWILNGAFGLSSAAE